MKIRAPWRRACEQWADRLDRFIDILLALMLAAMALAVFYQVLGRYVIGRAPAWSEELARFLLLFMTLLGCVSALRAGSHICVTAVFDSASPRVRHALFWLRDLALGAVLVLTAWQGYGFAELNLTQSSPAFEIPMAVPNASLPISALLMLLQLVLARLSGRPVPVASGEGEPAIRDEERLAS